MTSSLRPNLERALRVKTAVGLWLAAVVITAQQFLPTATGVKQPIEWYLGLSALAVANVFVILIIHRRYYSDRVFLRFEQFSTALSFVMIALVVWHTGGAYCPYIVMWFSSILYCAYFMIPIRAVIAQVTIGTAGALTPLVYDYERAISTGFIPLVVITMTIYYVIAGIVVVHRRRVRAADLQLRELALTDALTGVANVRAFEEYSKQLLEPAPTAEPFSLAIVDLDGLKRANAKFGHTGGDDMIRRAATVLCASAGADCQVCRIGGDEFAVLLPATAAENAANWKHGFAKKLREHNEALTVFEPRVSASVGIATYGADGTTLEEMQRTADKRMYEDKTLAYSQQLVTDPDAAVTPVDGGKTLEARSAEPIRRNRIVGTVRAAVWSWAVGGFLLLVSAPLPGLTTHQSNGLLIAGACSLLIAGWCAIGIRFASKFVGTTADIAAIVFPGAVVLVSGAAHSPAVALPLLVAVYYATALGKRTANIRIAACMIFYFLAFFSDKSAVTNINQSFAITIAAYVAATVTLIRFNGSRISDVQRRASEIASVDPLTGVANRRVFERRLSSGIADATEGFERSARAGGSVRPAVILIDLDDFKHTNTTFGHAGGDRLLREVAECLRDAAGDDGEVSRLGGDEFAVTLQAVNVDDVEAVAERCRAEVHRMGKLLADTTPGARLTVSVGYSMWREGLTSSQLMAEADSALRGSKDSGKDTVSAARWITAA